MKLHTSETTGTLFDRIVASLCQINGPEIDLCATIIDLCAAINSEQETNWFLGEGEEFTLGCFIVGAYWALTEWHGGQTSESYAALCAVGSIYQPGFTSGPEGTSEEFAYEQVNAYFEGTA